MKLRPLAILGLLLAAATGVSAREKAFGICTQQSPLNADSNATPHFAIKVQQVSTSCTVTVYINGTTTLATLYSDNIGTVKSNPFQADTNGLWFFYADNGRYDVQFSGGAPTISPAYTYSDYLLCDGCAGGGGGGGGSGPVLQTNETNNISQILLDFQNATETPTGKQISFTNPSGGIEHAVLTNVAPSTGGSTLIGDITDLLEGQTVCADSATHLANCTPGVPVVNDTSAAYAVRCGVGSSSDRASIITEHFGSASAFTVPAAESTGCDNGFSFGIVNYGSGTVTLTPATSTISYGSTFGASSMPVLAGQGAFVYENSNGYFAFLVSSSSSSGCDTTGFADQSVLFIHPLSTCAVDPNFLWDETAGKDWLLVGLAPVAPGTFDNFNTSFNIFPDWNDTQATFGRIVTQSGPLKESCVICVVGDMEGTTGLGFTAGIEAYVWDNAKETASNGVFGARLEVFNNNAASSTIGSTVGAQADMFIDGAGTGQKIFGFATQTQSQTGVTATGSHAIAFNDQGFQDTHGAISIYEGFDTQATINGQIDGVGVCGFVVEANCAPLGTGTLSGSWAILACSNASAPNKCPSYIGGDLTLFGSVNQSGGSVNFTGGAITLKPLSLSNPGAGPTLTVTGGAGTTWGYKYVAVAGDAHSVASSETTASAAATLDVSNFITIQCPSLISGATSYDIYRTTVGTSPNTTGKIATLNGNCTLANGTNLVDNGLAGDSSTPPATNNTGNIFIDGPIINATTSFAYVSESYCGTTTTCANTAISGPRVIFGSVALNNASPSIATVASISPAFTSSSSYVCTVTNATSSTNGLKVANVSSSSFTITGPNTVTDTVNYVCTGN